MLMYYVFMEGSLKLHNMYGTADSLMVTQFVRYIVDFNADITCALQRIV